MKLSDYDFNLPAELIAQHPSDKRDHSDLLICLANHEFQKKKFFKIIDFFKPGDVLVVNDSKVLNAQLDLLKGTKMIRINLNKPIGGNKWLGFARPAKKLTIGDEFIFGEHKVVVTNKFASGEIELEFVLQGITITDFLDTYGSVPLPPYIKRDKTEEADKERYQNVYSKSMGSVAAPTAGLHFTEDLLAQIKAKGVKIVPITLHVGAGTFLPVKTENINEHRMHSEIYNITPEAASAINEAKACGRRIIAVGTTTVRTLESAAKDGQIKDGMFETSIFITPGYNFQIPDFLITNFHLPKSTLFMLVSAFAGTDYIKSAYNYAIEHRMRFFSYGDAMLIERNS